MEKYPGYETYRALYARYYKRESTDFLRLLGPLEGMVVADLCGGDGRLTYKMLKLGARSVFFVDEQVDMVPYTLWNHRQIQVVINDVHSALYKAILRGDSFDRIVCQQAVNYWLDCFSAPLVASALKPDGVFVFNTFNEKPPKEPRVLQYKLEGYSFVEVSWIVDDKVHHIQVREAIEPHHTIFSWLSPERIRRLLEPHFVISEERNEKTSLYRCVKK